MPIRHQDIRKMVKKGNPVIVEIGAHSGYDSKKFLKSFKNIRLYCFEPDPRCIVQFKERISDSRCVLIESAVCNTDGKTILNMSNGMPIRNTPGIIKKFGLTRLYVEANTFCRYLRGKNKEWDYSSSIKESVSHSEDHPWLGFDKTVEVPTIKLDTWVRQNNIGGIDFLWMDVQGAEGDVIEGAEHTLKSVRYLYTEYGELSAYPEAMTREATIALMEKYHFKLVEMYSDDSETKCGNLLFTNRDI